MDLAIYLDDLLRDMKSSLDPAWADAIQTEFAPILVSADRAVSIGLLTNEIVANAIKYAYDGQPGPVSVVLSQTRNGMLLSVTDNGVGSDGPSRAPVLACGWWRRWSSSWAASCSRTRMRPVCGW